MTKSISLSRINFGQSLRTSPKFPSFQNKAIFAVVSPLMEEKTAGK